MIRFVIENMQFRKNGAIADNHALPYFYVIQSDFSIKSFSKDFIDVVFSFFFFL